MDAIIEGVLEPSAEEGGEDTATVTPKDERNLIEPSISPQSKKAVTRLHNSSLGRVDTPLRKRFVRAAENGEPAPLASFFQRGGRGAQVDLKVYLALLWRCSSKPFTTELSARQIALLLDLDDPFHKGARRVTAALSRLQKRDLIAVTPRRGESSVIKMLSDRGDGEEYLLPSGMIKRGKKVAPDDPNLYMKVPYALWSSGHMQGMSTPALAMLLIILSEGGDSRDVWFSTDEFPARYRISASVRARGTQELLDRRLLMVKKKLVEGGDSSFGRERVRNLYRLRGDAAPAGTGTLEALMIS